MIRLVGSLLTLARADAGQTPIARERLDLAQLVRDACDQMQEMARAKQVSLTTDALPLEMVGDEDLLLQLVLNLLDNAIKYSPSGGSVTVACSRETGHAVVQVSDTGPGISPEHLPRIFDRFYRVDASRTRGAGSAGLGLSISRWIAEAHGGELTAESEPGRGSTFILRVPPNR
jgi:signal transduction histidine kinase